MNNNESKTIFLNIEKPVEVYFQPLQGEFNISPFCGGLLTANDIDSDKVLDEYRVRFDEAWRELAEK